MRDQGVFTSIAAQTAVRITNSLNWLTLPTAPSASTGRPTGRSRPRSATPSHAATAQATGVIAEDHRSLQLQTSKSLPSGEGFGYRASTRIAQVVSGDAQLQYQTLFGRYGATAASYGGARRLTLGRRRLARRRARRGRVPVAAGAERVRADPRARRGRRARLRKPRGARPDRPQRKPGGAEPAQLLRQPPQHRRRGCAARVRAGGHRDGCWHRRRAASRSPSSGSGCRTSIAEAWSW